MGNSKPDEDSSHEHELVTDDELLEDGAALSPAKDDDLHEPPRGLRLGDSARRALVGVGEVLLGKYRVERVHAPGALGVSCDALHVSLRQRVVVKLGLAGARPGSEGAARFLRSARLAAQLRSEHLARVLDLGTLESGIPYTVTEHVSGTDLRGVLRVREWLPVSEAIDYVLQVCEGLAVAHVAGLVHGNLKLSNVFLARDNDGRPIIKVLDFCSSDVASSDASITMSTTESVVNSLAYLAPEQVRDPGSVDLRADIWAIGALLHELLTGVPLHAAASVPGIFAAIAADSATPISKLRSELPSELEEIVLRCLEKERDYRWPDVGTLAKQLRRFASPQGRDAVDRVVMVLERRARSSRSLFPPAMPKVDAPRAMLARAANAAAPPQPSQNRRFLEVALATVAVIGCSVSIGAFVAVHNLRALLASRGATQSVVASLSPALPAAPERVTPAPAVVAQQAAPAQAAANAAKVWSKPAAHPVETPVRSADAPAPHQAVLEPSASSQALFDKAN